MEEQGGEQPIDQPTKPEPVETPATVSAPAPFPNFILLVLLLIWLGTYFSRPVMQSGAERIRLLYYPAETTLRFSGAEMFAYEGAKSMGEAGKLILQIDDDSDSEMAAWLGNMFEESMAELEQRGRAEDVRQLQMNQAILFAELGDEHGMRESVKKLRRDARNSQFVRLYQSIYAGGPPAGGGFNFEELGSAWSRWQFEARAAHLKGDHERFQWLNSWLRETESKQGVQLARIAILNWLLGLLGVMTAGVYVIKRGWRAAAQAQDFPGTLREGLGMFLCASLAGQALFWALSKSPLFTREIWSSHSLVWAIPVVAVVWWRLGRHDGSAMLRFFGWSEGAGGWLRLLKLGALAFPAVWCALMLPNVILEALGMEAHWTEGWNEAKLFESGPGKLLMSITMVVWAPLQEEMLMRGIFYAGLRRRLGVTAAVLVSACVFGALHYYSFAGFVSVTCFGMAMAWLYERTGSWVPGFWVHLLTNLLLCIWYTVILG